MAKSSSRSDLSDHFSELPPLHRGRHSCQNAARWKGLQYSSSHYLGGWFGWPEDVLGHWVADGEESANFWLSVLSDLQNRGVEDIFIASVDGLTGFSEAIPDETGEAFHAVFPKALVQRCVIHQIRNSLHDFTVCCNGHAQGVINHLFIQDGEHAGHTQTYGAGVGVGRRSERCRAGTEDFGFCFELRMNFKPYNRFIFHV